MTKTVWLLLAIFSLGDPPHDYAVATVFQTEDACRLDLAGWRAIHSDRALYLCVPASGRIPLLKEKP